MQITTLCYACRLIRVESNEKKRIFYVFCWTMHASICTFTIKRKRGKGCIAHVFRMHSGTINYLNRVNAFFFRGLWLERRTTNNNYFLHIINMGFFFNFAKQLSTSNLIRHNKSHQFMHHDILIFHISQTFALQSSWRSEGYYLVFWRKKNVPADAWVSSKFLNGFDMKKKTISKRIHYSINNELEFEKSFENGIFYELFW